MKKRANVLLILCMLGVLLLGWSEAGWANIPTVERIQKAGKIRVGTNFAGPPISFKDDKGTPMGYDVDWAYKMAEILGVDVEFVDVDGETRISSLVAGRTDVVFNNITGNLARAQIIDFSIPYLKCGIKMLTRAGLPYNDIEELNDPKVRIVVGRGTTGEDLVLKYAPKAEIIYVPGLNDQLLHLMQDRADVAFEDNTNMDYAAAQSGGKLVVKDRMYSSDPICIGLPKGDLEFVRWVDMFVSWQITQGWQAETYEKWWGVPPGEMKSLW